MFRVMHSPDHYEKQWLSETANQGMVSVVRVTGDAPVRVTGGASVCVTDRLLVEPMRPCV